MISSGSFDVLAEFMPGVKVLIQVAMQLGTYLEGPRWSGFYESLKRLMFNIYLKVFFCEKFVLIRINFIDYFYHVNSQL